MADPGEHARYVRLRSRVRPELWDVDGSLELFNTEESLSLFRIEEAPPVPVKPHPPRLTKARRRLGLLHSEWRVRIRVSSPQTPAVVWQLSLGLPRLNVRARQAAAMVQQFSRVSRPRLLAGKEHAAALLRELWRVSRPRLHAGKERAAALVRELSHVSLPRLTASERRAAAIVVITGVTIAATAGQLRVYAPKSAAPVAARARELPSKVPFAASMLLAVPVRAHASAARAATASGDAVDRHAVQATLNGYRDALSTLDAGAVAAVWPSANVDALRRQFAGIKDQNLDFDQCRISIGEVRADALCSGVIETGLVPRSRRPHSSRVRWQFTLERTGHRWLIRSVATGAI
jgi:hypothetical protein